MFTAIEKTCPKCGAKSVIVVLTASVKAYNECPTGTIQDYFPYLDSTKREVLISGLCKECQDTIFGTGENDD